MNHDKFEKAKGFILNLLSLADISPELYTFSRVQTDRNYCVYIGCLIHDQRREHYDKIRNLLEIAGVSTLDIDNLKSSFWAIKPDEI